MGLLTFLLWVELLAARGEEVQSARQQLRRGWGGGLDSHPQPISQCRGGTAAPHQHGPAPRPHYAPPRSAGRRRRGLRAAAQLLW